MKKILNCWVLVFSLLLSFLVPFTFFSCKVFANIEDGSDLAGIKGYSYEYAYLATSSWTTIATDLKDGNLVLLTQPITLPGFGKALSFEMAYNSVNYSLDNGIGKGWICNLFETIVENPNTHQITYIDKTGAKFIFEWDVINSIYITPKGFEGSLEKLSNGYQITDLNSISIVFLSTGKLSKISQCNLDLLSIHYDASDKPDVIHDLISGRTISITWSNDHITEMKDSLNQIWKLNYSQSNFLLSLEKPDQSKAEFSYDEDGRMITHTDFEDLIYSFSYITEQTYNGRIYKITLPGSLDYTYSYAGTTDGYESKTTVADPENRSTEYYFGASSHHLEKVLMEKDAIEVKTILAYDSFYFLSEVQDSANHSILFTRNSDHQITEITYPPDQGTLSYQIQYSYNSSHQKTQKREKINSTPLWAITTMEYNDTDFPCKPSKVIDPLGNETIYDYNANHQVISLITGTGSFQENNQKTRTYSYNSNNANIQSSIDPEGNETLYAVNANGFITDEIQYEGPSANGQITSNITTTYDTTNQQTSKHDNLTDLTATKTFNGNGAITSSTSFGGCSQGSTYNKSYMKFFKPGTGNGVPPSCSMQNLYLMNPTITKYINYDKFTSIGSVAPDFITYNPVKNSMTDSSNQTTAFEYFGEGTIKKQTDFMGRETNVTLDDFGRINKITEWNGKETEFGYDTNNRLVSKIEEGIGTFGYTYFNSGKLSSVTDPQKGQSFFSYDLSGNILSDEKAFYSYDLKGRKIATNYISDSPDFWSFTRDGYLASINTTFYTTDKLGNIMQINNEYGIADINYIKSDNLITSVTGTNAMGNYQLTYGPNKLLANFQDMDNLGLYLYGWNTDGTQSELQYPNQTIQTTTYQSKQPDAVSVKFDTNDRFRSDTAYNSNNQVNSFEYQIFTSQGNPSETTTAQYDILHRVSSLLYASDSQTIQYQYSTANGLPSSVNISGSGDFGISRDTPGRITSIVYPNNTGTEIFSYNSSWGRLSNIQYPNNRLLNFSWNSKNQITQVFGMDNGSSFSYTTSYDALGRMKTYTKTENGMQTEVWNISYGVFGIEKATRSSFGTQNIVMDFSTDRYGKVLAMNYQQLEGYNGHLYFHYDNYGNIAILTDSQGSVQVGYLYKLHSGKISYEYNPQNIVNLFAFNGRSGNITLGTFSNDIKIQVNLNGIVAIMNPYGSIDLSAPAKVYFDTSKINVTLKDSVSTCSDDCEKKGMVRCCKEYRSQEECEKNCNDSGNPNGITEQNPNDSVEDCIKKCTGNTCKEWGCCTAGQEPIK